MTKIIDLPLGAGKTTTLLRYLALPRCEDVFYVAPLRRMASDAYEESQSSLFPEVRDLSYLRFLSTQQALDLRTRGVVTRVVVDEILDDIPRLEEAGISVEVAAHTSDFWSTV